MQIKKVNHLPLILERNTNLHPKNILEIVSRVVVVYISVDGGQPRKRGSVTAPRRPVLMYVKTHLEDETDAQYTAQTTRYLKTHLSGRRFNTKRCDGQAGTVLLLLRCVTDQLLLLLHLPVFVLERCGRRCRRWAAVLRRRLRRECC